MLLRLRHSKSKQLISMTEFNLRLDERTRMETELVAPCATVLSIATIILYIMSTSVPGQFAGHFQIPSWGAVLGGIVLIVLGALKLQRPTRYELNADHLSVVTPMVTHRIPYASMKEVVSVADRSAQPLARAIFSGTCKRAVQGLGDLMQAARPGTKAGSEGTGQHNNYTTSDTGGVQIFCQDGGSVLLSPAELSAFLSEIEKRFYTNRLEVNVVREVRVQIGNR